MKINLEWLKVSTETGMVTLVTIQQFRAADETDNNLDFGLDVDLAHVVGCRVRHLTFGLMLHKVSSKMHLNSPTGTATVKTHQPEAVSGTTLSSTVAGVGQINIANSDAACKWRC